MLLTGGYAGITKGQFDALAGTIAGKTNTAIGTAKKRCKGWLLPA